MYIDRIYLQNFRNIHRAEINFFPYFNIIEGKNGQGKTNLLESVYLLSTARSFRSRERGDFIRWESEGCELKGIVREGALERELAVSISPGGRRLTVNRNPVRRFSDFAWILQTVVFSPDDLLIVKGSPSLRRRYLDQLCFQLWRGYAGEAQKFNAALRHRNALLKTRGQSPAWREQMRAWTDQLLSYGARVSAYRQRAVERLDRELDRSFRLVADETKRARLVYRCSAAGDTQGGAPAQAPEQAQKNPVEGAHLETPPDDGLTRALREAYAEELSRRADHERLSGSTPVGPHRDDFAMLIDGREAQRFGSQGQQRLFVLSLKLGELSCLGDGNDGGGPPVLLLDDFSSELDAERIERSIEYLLGFGGQVILTTTSIARLPLPPSLRGKRFRVEQGVVEDLGELRACK